MRANFTEQKAYLLTSKPPALFARFFIFFVAKFSSRSGHYRQLHEEDEKRSMKIGSKPYTRSVLYRRRTGRSESGRSARQASLHDRCHDHLRAVYSESRARRQLPDVEIASASRSLAARSSRTGIADRAHLKTITSASAAPESAAVAH
jgi:hypothetical protein